MRTMDLTETTVENDRRRPLISWGAIFGGAILGFALLALLSSLWLALGMGSEIDVVAGNLGWFVGVSAIACLFFAGILTGYLAGARSATAGLMNALALWALLLVLTLTVGIPAIFNVFSLGRVVTEVDRATTGTGVIASGADSALWVSFWTILGTAMAAGLGGLIGGAGGRETTVSRTTAVDRKTDQRSGEDGITERRVS